MKVGEKTNFGRLATIFQICSMDADIPLKVSPPTKRKQCLKTLRHFLESQISVPQNEQNSCAK